MGIKEDTIKKLSKKTNIDSRVVKMIADYPMKFARDRMADAEDDRPIRIRYFGVFLHKSASNEYSKKENFDKTWKYSATKLEKQDKTEV